MWQKFWILSFFRWGGGDFDISFLLPRTCKHKNREGYMQNSANIQWNMQKCRRRRGWGERKGIGSGPLFPAVPGFCEWRWEWEGQNPGVLSIFSGLFSPFSSIFTVIFSLFLGLTLKHVLNTGLMKGTSRVLGGFTNWGKIAEFFLIWEFFREAERSSTSQMIRFLRLRNLRKILEFFSIYKLR